MTRSDDPHQPAGDSDAPVDDYLWDRSGTPDPEVAALEQALTGARWTGTPMHSAMRPATHPATRDEPVSAPLRRPGRAWKVCAAAACLVALGLSARMLWSAQRDPARGDGGLAERVPGPEATDTPRFAVDTPGFAVEALSGAVARTELRRGDRLQTDAATRARLTIGDLGSVVVEPDTHLRVDVADGDVPNQLFLERGALTASIFAAPRLFAIGTPSGLAVDLGCVYTARVESDGSARLSVLAGHVSFESEGRQVSVPAGASVLASPGSGPGTPVWDDAPVPFRDAVASLDAAVATAAGVPSPTIGAASPTDAGTAVARALDAVLTTDRARDSLTLWHLLAWPAMPDVGRQRVLEVLTSLAPPPADVDRAACLAGDEAMLRRWRLTCSWSP